MFAEKANPQANYTPGDFFIGQMNIERSTSNVELEKMKKQKY
jgi:hypothetical protein